MGSRTSNNSASTTSTGTGPVTCSGAVSLPSISDPGTITAALRALMPTHPVCADALALARSRLPATILYHSFRVYMYAQAFMRITPLNDPADPSLLPSFPGIARISPSSGEYAAICPPHVLFVACILHAIGLAREYDTMAERFEVIGADVAARLLRSHNVPALAVREAWLAISLHTNPTIAERMSGAVPALRFAKRADLGFCAVPPVDSLPGGATSANLLRWQLPRLEIKKQLGDAVVRQALKESRKAPRGSWAAELVRGKEEHPDWEGINKCFNLF
ncbi:hypothetical protein QBC32DRAFT_395283 [Pseudoneurospora amorphoporcata]|uniref:Uncharacterized protein n=1 Tax=Pseudoneurospora amorphoporcata TaxID=241081 RepID=A0AAN6P510_9PEZI|nr:hypothetical protein QBC32DRAFT_395283 [Pseudoneurospora amorphoporcata]